MLSSPTLPLLVALLASTFTAAQHPLIPTAGGSGAKVPAKRIEGLLGLASRQLFCDPGYGICDNGCCLDGGSCCSKTGYCCPFAPNTAECCTCEIHDLNLVLNHFFFDFVTDIAQLVDVVSPGETYCAVDSNGNEGCCPNGQICSGGGGVGGGGGSGGGETTTPKTTEKAPPPTRTTTQNPTTHKVPPPTTTHTTPIHSEDDHTDVSTPIPSPTSSGSTTPTSSGSTTPPTAGPGTQNVWASVDSTQITWVGEWVSIVSTCNATSKAKRCSGESSLDAIGSMSYTFTGYSIAMSFSSSNLAYNVSINGKSWSFGQTDASDAKASNCTYDVVYTVTAGAEQLISVEVLTLDTAALSRRRELEERTDSDGPWHLDVNDFVIQVAGTSATATATSTAEVPTLSGSFGPTNSAWRLGFAPPLSSIIVGIGIAIGSALA
ncbi:hypothetical protein K438DRAFT_1974376 [Mycena galopus ATCC 62051]|nr:hypothetical protein K438DRAFT_1974376 [Mycena galopus ATCC 62051]